MIALTWFDLIAVFHIINQTIYGSIVFVFNIALLVDNRGLRLTIIFRHHLIFSIVLLSEPVRFTLYTTPLSSGVDMHNVSHLHANSSQIDMYHYPLQMLIIP